MKQKLFKIQAALAAILHRTCQRVRSIRTHCSLLIARCSSRRVVRLANIAEGTHSASQGISYKSDAVITERFLLAKRGASADAIDICGAANIPIGVINDEAGAIGDYVAVAQFNSDLTLRMVASAAIAQDALLEPAANGRVATLIADRAYDRDSLRTHLEARGIELVCPHRRGRKKKARQDGRKLRRYRRRRKIERTFAWLGNFRRLVVRYERHPQIYKAFFQLACVLITIRHF